MENAHPSSIKSSLCPRIGVACVVQREGKVLMGKRLGSHGAGLWAFPGGHLEFQETVEECAKRELLEETGLLATETRLSTWVENVMENGTKHYITIFVLITQFSGVLEVKEPHKCAEWKWASWEQLPSPLFETVVSFVSKIQTLDSAVLSAT